ncbi:MAG: protease modulator HflC [Gemmataceae bacterium]
MKRVALVVIALLLLGLLGSAPYAVDQAEFAYVTQFGRPVETVDGASDAGLHFKLPWPVQSVQRIDRRLQMFDLPGAELPTFDPQGQTIDKMLTVDGYVCWQIADRDGVDRFIRTVGTPERARAILGPRIGGRLGAVVSRMPLEELIHVVTPNEPGVEARIRRVQDALIGEGSEDLKRQVRDEYGIELVDVRLRRFNYPDSVRPAIFERIRSERKRKAADHESDGEKRAREIVSAAKRDADIVRSTAEAHADLTRRQADADADRIRNEAHSKDREFYTFLQKLETYKQMLSRTTDMLLLSSRHPLFQLLLNPPGSETGRQGDKETRRQGDKETRKPEP